MVGTVTHLVYTRGYSIAINAITFLYSHLKWKIQVVNISNSESLFKILLSGVHQESIIGPIFFNVFSNDLLIFINEAKLGW